MAEVRWTAERLERALRLALPRSSLKVRPMPGETAADVEWSDARSKARVRLDDHEVAVRAGVLHELMHVVLEDALSGFDSELAEQIILALEKHMDARVARSRRRRLWWRSQIEALRR